MKKIILLSCIFVLILVGCAPSKEQIEKAIAETQAAEISLTPTPDLRMFDPTIDYMEYLPTESDLKNMGYPYTVAKGLFQIPEGKVDNEALFGDDIDEQEYIIIHDLGRITGWTRETVYREPDGSGGLGISCDIHVFQTSHGAQEMVRKYNFAETGAWDYVDEHLDLGDEGVLLAVKDKGNPGWNILEFSYKNLVITVDSHKDGQEAAFKVAQFILEKLKTAPLVEQASNSQEMLGKWVNNNNSTCQNISISKSGESVYLTTLCGDGSNDTIKLTVITKNGENRLYEDPNNAYGDYMVINSNGSLSYYDNKGLIYTLQP